MAGVLLNSTKSQTDINAVFSLKRMMMCCFSGDAKEDDQEPTQSHDADIELLNRKGNSKNDGADGKESMEDVEKKSQSDSVKPEHSVTNDDEKHESASVLDKESEGRKPSETQSTLVFQDVGPNPTSDTNLVIFGPQNDNQSNHIETKEDHEIKEDPFKHDPDEFEDEIDNISDTEVKFAKEQEQLEKEKARKERRKTGEVRLRITFQPVETIPARFKKKQIQQKSKPQAETKRNEDKVSEEGSKEETKSITSTSLSKEEAVVPTVGTLQIKFVDAIDLDRPSSTIGSIKDGKSLDNPPPPIFAYSIHTAVMPDSKMRHKTKMRQGPDPYFDEVFKTTKANIEDIRSWSLRIRLYGSMRNSMKTVIGEGYLPLNTVEIEARTQCKIALLEPDPSQSDDELISTLMFASQCKYESMTSLDSLDRIISNQHDTTDSATTIPELLIGLMYNFNSGRLTVEVLKGSKFPLLKDNKFPDTYIKVALTNIRGEELESSKTTVKKASQDPIFDETFVYQVMAYQLMEVNIMISGYTKQSLGRKTLFGYFHLGTKGQTEEEKLHWTDLSKAKQGDQIMRWHSLVLPNAETENP